MKKFKFKYDDIFNQVISMSFNPKLQNSILYEEDTLPNSEIPSLHIANNPRTLRFGVLGLKLVIAFSTALLLL